MERAQRGTCAVDSRRRAGRSRDPRTTSGTLGLEDLHSADDRDISDPLEAAFFPALRDHLAAPVASRFVHLALATGQSRWWSWPLAGNSGRLKRMKGSVGCDPGGLSKVPWSCSWLNARHTHPISPRAPLISYHTESNSPPTKKSRPGVLLSTAAPCPEKRQVYRNGHPSPPQEVVDAVAQPTAVRG